SRAKAYVETGVGSTEPAKSGGAGFAGTGAGTGVGSTEPAKSGGAGFAGTGAGTGVGSTEPAKSGGAGFAGAGAESDAVRVGLEYVQSVGEDDAKAVFAAQPFTDVRDLAQRTELSQDGLEALVRSGACDCFARPRRELL